MIFLPSFWLVMVKLKKSSDSFFHWPSFPIQFTFVVFYDTNSWIVSSSLPFFPSLNVFERLEPSRYKLRCNFSSIKVQMFDVLFQNDAALFNKFVHDIICNEETIEDFQLYILSKPELLQHVKENLSLKSFAYEEYAIITWYHTAFILICWEPLLWIPKLYDSGLYYNAQNMVWNACSKSSLPWKYMKDSVWKLKKYHMIIKKELFRFMNSTDLAPDNPDVYDEQPESIKSKYTSMDRDNIILLFRCASLSNKMGLFRKLMECYRPLILNYASVMTNYIYKKFPLVFINSFSMCMKLSDFNDRQLIYSDSNLFTILSDYYRICSIEWNKDEATIKIEFKTNHNDARVPEFVTVDRIFKKWADFQ